MRWLAISLALLACTPRVYHEGGSYSVADRDYEILETASGDLTPPGYERQSAFVAERADFFFRAKDSSGFIFVRQLAIDCKDSPMPLEELARKWLPDLCKGALRLAGAPPAACASIEKPPSPRRERQAGSFSWEAGEIAADAVPLRLWAVLLRAGGAPILVLYANRADRFDDGLNTVYGFIDRIDHVIYVTSD